jgi:hypothetical protein
LVAGFSMIWFITDFLAVPPPWESLVLPYFCVVTDEGLLTGVPLTWSFRYIK